MQNKVLKATFWYTFSNLLLKGLVFFTTPIFSRVLTKAEFGSFSNYAAWYQLLGIIITLSLLPSLIRGRFEYEKNLNSFIASNLLLGSLSTLFFSIFIFINLDFFSSLFVLEKKYIIIMCLTLLFSPAYEMFMATQRFAYKYKTVAILTILISASSIALSLLLIFLMKDHLLARVIGSVIPSFIVSFIVYIYYLFHCKQIKIEYWRYSLPICIPYIFHLLSGSVLGQSDRAMITSLVGAESTAIYSMAYNVALAVNILWSSMNSAYGPWLGEKLHSNNYSSIKKHTHGYLAMFAVLIVSLMLIAPEALLFLGGHRYLEAKYVIPPVMVGCYFIFVYSMYVNVEQFENRTKPMAIVTFLAALINIITNYIFIPIYGYIAAAYTTLFCYFLLWLFHYYLVRRMGLHIIYDTKFIIAVSIAVCLVMFLSSWLYQMTVIRYIVLVCYAGALGYVGLKNKKKIMVYFWR